MRARSYPDFFTPPLVGEGRSGGQVSNDIIHGVGMRKLHPVPTSPTSRRGPRREGLVLGYASPRDCCALPKVSSRAQRLLRRGGHHLSRRRACTAATPAASCAWSSSPTGRPDLEATGPRRGPEAHDEPTPRAGRGDRRLRRRSNGSGRPLRSEQLAEDATGGCTWAGGAAPHRRPCCGPWWTPAVNAISAKDCEGRFTMVNAALASIFGCAPEELWGQSVAPPGVQRGWTARIAAMDQRVVENKAGRAAGGDHRRAPTADARFSRSPRSAAR